jgi:hypothetical protein
MDVERQALPLGPTLGSTVAAWAVPLALCLATIGVLVKLAHRHGGRGIVGLLPHAFDASSAPQSGAFALSTFAVAIVLGYAGLKLHPRSYAIVVSAGMLLLGSLAMVTVTLVATEEHPTPPDGALLIPYVVPLALFLLGTGVLRRGAHAFLAGGLRRVAGAFAGAASGVLLFAATELSALAALLP